MKRTLTLLLALIFVLSAVPAFAGAEEQPTLMLSSFNWGWDDVIPEEDIIGPEVEKLLGFKLGSEMKLKVGSYEEVEKKLQLWAAAGMSDWPGIVAVGTLSTTRDICNRLGAAGKLLDFNTILDKIPNTVENSKDAMPIMTTADGALYMFPQSWQDKQSYRADTRNYIRKDWLDKVGLDYPKTIKELDAALRAFKTLDIEGGAIPYLPFGEDLGGFWDIPLHWFIPENMQEWQTVDGESRYMYFEDPKYLVNMLQWYNKWYHDGLIDQEVFTLKSGQIDEKNNAGRVGLMHGSYWAIKTDPFYTNNPDAAYVMPPLIYDDEMMAEPNALDVGMDVWAAWVIRADLPQEQIDMFCKYLEMAQTEEGTLLTHYGIKDVHWMFNEEGKVVDTPECAELYKGDWNLRVHIGIDAYAGVPNYALYSKFLAPSSYELREDSIAGWENIGSEFPTGYVTNVNRYVTPGPVEMQARMGFDERRKELVRKCITGAYEDVEKTVQDWVQTEMAMDYEAQKAERTALCAQMNLKFGE